MAAFVATTGAWGRGTPHTVYAHSPQRVVQVGCFCLLPHSESVKCSFRLLIFPTFVQRMSSDVFFGANSIFVTLDCACNSLVLPHGIFSEVSSFHSQTRKGSTWSQRLQQAIASHIGCGGSLRGSRQADESDESEVPRKDEAWRSRLT